MIRVAILALRWRVAAWRATRRRPAFIGATERWSPLASIASQPVSPDLVSETELASTDHQALHDVERRFQVELDSYFAALFVAQPWLASWFALDATGEIPLVRA